MSSMTKDTESVRNALPESVRNKLRPIRTFRAVDDLPATSNLMDLEYALDPRRPFDVLPITETFEDKTTLEYLDPKLLAVKQVGQDGEPQVVVLTPAQVIYLCHKASNVIMLPAGGPLVQVSEPGTEA